MAVKNAVASGADYLFSPNFMARSIKNYKIDIKLGRKSQP
jgi:hypothetical protein